MGRDPNSPDLLRTVWENEAQTLHLLLRTQVSRFFPPDNKRRQSLGYPKVGFMGTGHAVYSAHQDTLRWPGVIPVLYRN